jgi:uncharacterized SAM-binding protein YcdF (DUF218 family)
MTAHEESPSGPKPRRRSAWRLIAVPLVLIGLWLAGLVWYAEDIPRTVEDPATPTDAVVVLTGGSGRLDVGFHLLAENRAKKLFISGVAREVNTDELIKLYGNGRTAELSCCVVIGHVAGDTAGNARETARFMQDEGYSSLRLVTASYHMRRSLLEFRRAMPGVTMIAHPVFPEGFRAGEWWRWPGTLMLLTSEYSKYLAATVRQALGIGLLVRHQAPAEPANGSKAPSSPGAAPADHPAKS